MLVSRTVRRWASRLVFLFFACGCTGLPGVGGPASDDGRTVRSSCDGRPDVEPLRIGVHSFCVAIALTPQAREEGLMGRDFLADDEGMLFVYDSPQILSFWMLNTSIPLDVAFIRDDGTISSIESMTPLTTNQHRSAEPVRFALELAGGEFTRRDIAPGDKVDLPPGVE